MHKQYKQTNKLRNDKNDKKWKKSKNAIAKQLFLCFAKINTQHINEQKKKKIKTGQSLQIIIN